MRRIAIAAMIMAALAGCAAQNRGADVAQSADAPAASAESAAVGGASGTVIGALLAGRSEDSALRGALVGGLVGVAVGTAPEMAARQKNYARQHAADGPSVQTDDAAYYALQSLPRLPSPLPTPSAKTACPKPEAPSLESYQALIDGALISAGHSESSYFRFENGFAVVSKLEHIEEDGAPAAEDRWPDVSLTRRRSLIDFIASFIAPQPGYYRFAVVTVGGVEPTIDVSARQTPEGGAALLAEGAASRPDLTGAAVDPSLKCTIVIYEFEQEPSGEKTKQRFPSKIPAVAHARYLGFKV